jgi:hypothetical protein
LKTPSGVVGSGLKGNRAGESSRRNHSHRAWTIAGFGKM